MPDKNNDRTMTLTTARERGSIEGKKENFTGKATISMLFAPGGPRNFGGASVSFQPCARTVWHSHSAGQTLIVIEGTGWVRAEGGKRQEMKPGDVV